MNKLLYILSLTILLVSCGNVIEIQIVNPTLDERFNQPVEFPVSELGLTAQQLRKLALYDSNNQKIAYQIINSEDDNQETILFFVSNIRGGMREVYHFRKGKPLSVKSNLNIQQINDTLFWENHYAIYSLPLSNENSPIGLILKKEPQVTINDFYVNSDIRKRRINSGLDCYQTNIVGLGQLALLDQEQHIIPIQHNAQFTLIDKGNLALRFRVDYDNSVQTITCYNSFPLNRIEVDNSADLDTLSLIVGVSIGDKLQQVSFSEKKGWLAYANDAVSEQGVQYGKQLQAVVLPNATRISVADKTLYAKVDDNSADHFVYYQGGSWTLNFFNSDSEWNKQIATIARDVQNPLNAFLIQKTN